MVRIGDLCADAIKEILAARDLPVTGSKAELIQRFVEATGTDEVQNESVQAQLNELRGIMETLSIAINTVAQNTGRHEQRNNIETNLSMVSQSENKPTMRNAYSVKEISETLPEFDPTDDQSLTAEQFVQRVNTAMSAYDWEEKGLMLAVFSKMKGAAKLWLDASNVVYSKWTVFSRDLIEEFGLNLNEAEIHRRMSLATRKPSEKIMDYCFRVCAIGKHYNLSEQAIIRYIRDGVKHRDLQNAIAAMRFRTTKELREHINEFFQSVMYSDSRSSTPRAKIDNVKKDATRTDSKPNIKCYNCEEEGHISSQCPKPPKRHRCRDCDKVHARGEPLNCGKPKVVRKASYSDLEKAFEKTVRIGERELKAFVDTGSHCTLVKRSIAYELPTRRETCALKINGICGGERLLNEKLIATVNVDKVYKTLDMYVVDDDMLTHDLLIGQNIFSDLVFTVENGKVNFAHKNSAVVEVIDGNETAVERNDNGNEYRRPRLD